MQFKFWDSCFSGWMAFTDPDALIIITDAGHDAVHVIDVVGQTHVGYVAAPGSLAGPRGIATRGRRTAISAWNGRNLLGNHKVHLFEGSGAEWVALRVLAYLYRPFGLRFTRDGAGLAVTCSGNNSATIISAVDGSLVRLIASGLSALGDIEECEGGWLVVVSVGFTRGLEFVSNDGVTRAKLMLNLPVSLALVPGLGLLVRDNGLNRIYVFWTADMVAMDAMSAPRVAWCSAVARAK